MVAVVLVLCLQLPEGPDTEIPVPPEPLPVTATVEQIYAEGVTRVALRLQDHEPQELLIAAIQLWCNNAPVTDIMSLPGDQTQEVHLLVQRPVTDAVLQKYEDSLRAILWRVRVFPFLDRPKAPPIALYPTGRVVRLSRDASRKATTVELASEFTGWLRDHPGLDVRVVRLTQEGELTDILILCPFVLDGAREQGLRKQRNRPPPTERELRLRWAV